MIFEKLSALIAEQFNVDADSITMETSFEDDLNADSVDIVDLSMALEEEFGIDELGEDEASGITTVGDLVRLLQSRIACATRSVHFKAPPNRRSFAISSRRRRDTAPCKGRNANEDAGRKAGLYIP